MRRWQRRAHPWIWLAVAIAVSAIFATLLRNDSGFADTASQLRLP
jgi:hypothetical protein